MATIDELYQQSLLSQLPLSGELPTTLTPYQRIMAQMTPTMNPYTGAGVAIGGYDPALYNRRSGSGLINYGGGGYGGGGGGGGGSDAYSDPNPAWSNMTNAEKAAYYAENPTMAGITQLGQKGFGYTSLGMLQNLFNPGFVSEQRLLTSLDPVAYQAAKENFRASEIADMNGGFQSIAAQQEAGRQAAQESFRSGEIAQQNADAQAAATQSISDQNTGGDGGGYGGYSDGGGSSSFGEGQYNMGGPVDRVGGPNPPGPDDGTGMLQLGEYVIKKSAVKKYGQGLLDMINDGKIPAKKMKSLLG
jgi:hypothetical protein